ncbi:hypothetical protein HK099_003229, partial [Clydaea vesicula]
TFEIKEYHFHIYFFQNNSHQVKKAKELFEKVQVLVEKDHRFKVKPLRVNLSPVGPHPTGSYEVWCPIERWITLNRGELNVLIHPLTTQAYVDHTTRSAFLGERSPIDVEGMFGYEEDEISSQYPKLKLGYAAEN